MLFYEMRGTVWEKICSSMLAKIWTIVSNSRKMLHFFIIVPCSIIFETFVF